MALLDDLIGKKWKDIHDRIKVGSENVETYFEEYENKREARNNQVGNRQNKITTSGEVEVNKIPIPFQRKIVQTASSFLFGQPLKFILDTPDEGTGEAEKIMFKQFKETWKDLRLDSKILQACEIAKSETRAAILLRAVVDGNTPEEATQDIELKATVLSSKNGKIFPGFNEFGDMIVFGYEFNAINDEGEEVVRLYLYLKETVIKLEIDGEDYIELEGSGKPHFFKRIPVVYIDQDVPDWYYVNDMIDRYEMSNSKFADTNDYFASPFFKATGDVNFEVEKDNTGTVYKLDIFETDHGNLITSDLDVVSWEHAPDSTKLEFENLKGLIYGMTNTPDLSFDNVKGLGNISGVALELMFLDPIVKAKYSEGTYKTAVERLMNIVKAGIVHVLRESSEAMFQMNMDVEFQSILPSNISEVVDRLSVATMNKPIMSQKRAIELNPLVDNTEEEMTQIQTESASDLGGTLNI